MNPFKSPTVTHVPTPTVQQAAPPDPAQTALAQKQMGLLELSEQRQAQQRAEEEEGRKVFEGLVGMPMPEYTARTLKGQTDLNQMLLDRYKKAAAGELPVSPSLERGLTEQEGEVRESMRRRLGPGWETSTPGITSLAEFKKRAEELREGARRGEITASEQQGYASPTSPLRPSAAYAISDVQTPTGLEELWRKYQTQQGMQGQFALAGYQGQLQSAMLNAQQKGQTQRQMLSQLHDVGMAFI